METLMKFLGGMALLFILLVGNAFQWGFVTYKLYNWFVLPNIALPSFTISQFVGFVLFIGAIMPVIIDYTKAEYKVEQSYRIAFSLVYPWFTLFGAWLVSLFL